MRYRPELGRIHRRRLLSGIAGAGVAAIAGCLGDETNVPEARAIEQGQSCDNCDMTITAQPGPAGQAYYLDNPPAALPDGRGDGIARFCSSWCTYTYVLEHDSEPAGVYTTDYSAVEYDIRDDGGTPVLSAHLDAADFAKADSLTYVVGSDVQGAMGGSLVGFSEESDAETFTDTYGGSLTTHSDITLETVRTL